MRIMFDQKMKFLTIVTILACSGSLDRLLHAPEDIQFDQPDESSTSTFEPLNQKNSERFQEPKNTSSLAEKNLETSTTSPNITDSGIHLTISDSNQKNIQPSSNEPLIASKTQRFKQWINNRSFENFSKIFQSNREILTTLIKDMMDHNSSNPLEQSNVKAEINKLSRQDRQILLTDVTEKEISLKKEPLSLSQARNFFIKNAAKYQIILPRNELIIPIENPSLKQRNSFQFEIINVSSVQQELESLDKLNPDQQKLNEIATQLKKELKLKLRISDIENNLKKYLQSLLVRQAIEKAHELLAEPSPQPSSTMFEPENEPAETELTNNSDTSWNISDQDSSATFSDEFTKEQEFPVRLQDIKSSYDIVKDLKNLKLSNNPTLFGIIFDQYKDRLSPAEIQEVEIYNPFNIPDTTQSESIISQQEPTKETTPITITSQPNPIELEPVYSSPSPDRNIATPENTTDEEKELFIQDSESELEELLKTEAQSTKDLANFLDESYLKTLYDPTTKTWLINPDREVITEIYNIMKNNRSWKDYSPTLKRYLSKNLFHRMFQDELNKLQDLIEQDANEETYETDFDLTPKISENQDIPVTEDADKNEKYQQLCQDVFVQNIFKEYEYIVDALKYRNNNLGFNKNANITHEEIVQKLLETQINNFKDKPENLQKEIIQAIAFKYRNDLNDLAIQHNKAEALKIAKQRKLKEDQIK